MPSILTLVLEDFFYELFTSRDPFADHQLTCAPLLDWCKHIALGEIQQEILILAKKSNGLHFNATHAHAAQLQDFSMDDMSTHFEQRAPVFWSFLFTIMNTSGDPLKQKHRASERVTIKRNWKQTAKMRGRDATRLYGRLDKRYQSPGSNTSHTTLGLSSAKHWLWARMDNKHRTNVLHARGLGRSLGFALISITFLYELPSSLPAVEFTIM
ncbi:hypothetical protein M422DRAFT_261770 [Sphaerobolus stellatus SS14]|uniref:Uncharacterized protein n=1 Tax=Sphaerobolus stellatus (strain SS14) TaxID=990650 RepID=A0A0C9V2E8_SPHS4|nr:hypothetical protein M422DRAFT_261770 [Sphaerobolus stellatus SS14]